VDQEKHPILAGVIALVSVALAVGLILGVAAFVGTKVLGIGGGDGKSATSRGASLYLPEPKATETPSGPQITLAPTAPTDAEGSDDAEEDEDEQADDEASDKEKKGKKKREKSGEITLQASPLSVSPGSRIDLTGIYPTGEGLVLKVQRKMGGGSWEDFPVHPVAVSGSQFSTYILTERTGSQSFRMVEVDRPQNTSNVVKVQIG